MGFYSSLVAPLSLPIYPPHHYKSKRSKSCAQKSPITLLACGMRKRSQTLQQAGESIPWLQHDLQGTCVTLAPSWGLQMLLKAAHAIAGLEQAISLPWRSLPLEPELWIPMMLQAPGTNAHTLRKWSPLQTPSSFTCTSWGVYHTLLCITIIYRHVKSQLSDHIYLFKLGSSSGLFFYPLKDLMVAATHCGWVAATEKILVSQRLEFEFWLCHPPAIWLHRVSSPSWAWSSSWKKE